jgi:hypothetical protein
MIFATPLDEEFADGHIGRLCLINRFKSPEVLRANLRRTHMTSVMRSRPASLYAMVAERSGMELNDYLLKHTLLPLKVTDDNGQSVFESAEDGSEGYQKWWLPRERRDAHFCPACAEGDIRRLGFPYWRRSHQIPGVEYCIEHDCPLISGIGAPPFLDIPRERRAVKRIVESKLQEVDQFNEVTKRYGQIASLFMQGTHRVLATVADTSIRRISMELNSNAVGSQAKSNLTSRLKVSFPHAWLQVYCPELLRSDRMPSIFLGNGRCTATVSCGQIYSMVLAIAFENAEDAMKAFCPDELQIAV